MLEIWKFEKNSTIPENPGLLCWQCISKFRTLIGHLRACACVCAAQFSFSGNFSFLVSPSESPTPSPSDSPSESASGLSTGCYYSAVPNTVQLPWISLLASYSLATTFLTISWVCLYDSFQLQWDYFAPPIHREIWEVWYKFFFFFQIFRWIKRLLHFFSAFTVPDFLCLDSLHLCTGLLRFPTLLPSPPCLPSDWDCNDTAIPTEGGGRQGLIERGRVGWGRGMLLHSPSLLDWKSPCLPGCRTLGQGKQRTTIPATPPLWLLAWGSRENS